MIILLTITSRLHQVTGQFFLHPNLYFDQISTRKTGHLWRTTKNELRPLFAEFHCNIVQCIQQSSPDLSNHFWTKENRAFSRCLEKFEDSKKGLSGEWLIIHQGGDTNKFALVYMTLKYKNIFSTHACLLRVDAKLPRIITHF